MTLRKQDGNAAPATTRGANTVAVQYFRSGSDVFYWHAEAIIISLIEQ